MRVNFVSTAICSFLLVTIVARVIPTVVPPLTPGFLELKNVIEQSKNYERIPHQNFPLPPKYLIELYQQQATEDGNHSDETTNKVRCILGKVKRETLLFNLTSLSGESFARAEIHLYRKKSGNGKFPRMKFFMSNSRQNRNLSKKFGSKKKVTTGDSLKLPTGGRGGWKKIDITKIIKTKYRKWKILNIEFEGLIPEFGTGKKIYHDLPLDEHIRIAYKPFLIIYSTLLKQPTRKQRSTNDILPFSSHLHKTRESQGTLNWNSLLYKGHEVNDLHSWTAAAAPQLQNLSVHADLDNRILPFEMSPVTPRGQRKKTKLKKPGNQKIPKISKFQPHLVSSKIQSSSGQCQLEERRISFIDFDWADTILAPASVLTNFCHGTCTTNDEPMDDIEWHNLNRRREKRKHLKDFCKAASFRRLSVLYVDSFDSIVLQSFGKMSIRTCSC